MTRRRLRRPKTRQRQVKAVFRHTIPIGRILGIPIDLDYSWFLIAILITWLLAVSYYPAAFKGGTSGEYWLMGAVTAVLFFASIIVHELAHSWVALRYKIPIHRITLFIFGGVSQIAAEPPSAAAEFLIAIAGPITSFALAAIFFLLERPLGISRRPWPWPSILRSSTAYSGLFNLIPGFPLDGGRVFRAIVWGVTKNFRRATVIAASTGPVLRLSFYRLGSMASTHRKSGRRALDRLYRLVSGKCCRSTGAAADGAGASCGAQSIGSDG